MSDTEYRFTVQPLSEDEGGGWLVEFPDLPGCMSDGETVEEAIANGEDAKCCWIAAMKEAGRPIPPPSVEPTEGFSGKRQLRGPKSLHRHRAERAKREGSASIPSPCRCLPKGGASARLMATEAPESEPAEHAPRLPEHIGAADLEALNQALAALLGELRFARSLPPGETQGRLGAVVALGTAWRFLTRFEPVLTETLHVPLMNLHSALLALNENNVEAILKPTKRTGRAASSPRRYALIGIAVGAAQRLEWTGLSPSEANKAVAAKLRALGIKPARGKNDVTADTLRRWRERINETQPLLRAPPQLLQSELSAEDLGWIAGCPKCGERGDRPVAREDRGACSRRRSTRCAARLGERYLPNNACRSESGAAPS